MGQRVIVRNLHPGLQWIPGTIIECKGPLSYLVQVAEGRIWKQHVDHLQETMATPQDQTSLILPASESTAESEVELPEMPNSSFDADSSSLQQATETFTSKPFKTFSGNHNRF